MTAVLALSLMSCVQAPSRAADFTPLLRTLQGRKVRVYLGGTPDASHTGTIAEIDPAAGFLTLENEFRNRLWSNQETSIRTKKVIRIDSILAVGVEESDR